MTSHTLCGHRCCVAVAWCAIWRRRLAGMLKERMGACAAPAALCCASWQPGGGIKPMLPYPTLPYPRVQASR